MWIADMGYSTYGLYPVNDVHLLENKILSENAIIFY